MFYQMKEHVEAKYGSRYVIFFNLEPTVIVLYFMDFENR
jgi:hypothetical protein